MTYLDSSRANELIRRFPGRFPPRDQRLVGVERGYDSGYHAIVRFFGSTARDPAGIEVTTMPGMYRIPDRKIQSFAAKVAQKLRDEGRLYDGPTVTGFRSLELTSEPPVMTVQETTYADFAGSLFALDLPDSTFDSHGGTLRDYYLAEYSHAPHADRPLANCLGVCGLALIEEGKKRYLLKIRRAARLATMAGTVGPSAAGSVDFHPNYRSAADILQRALGLEVEEELGLHREEFDIVPLAFALEIFRGDNPQLFGLIQVSLDRAQLSARLQALPENRREFSEFSFVELNPFGRLAVAEREAFNFEATMAYFLTEEYLEARN